MVFCDKFDWCMIAILLSMKQRVDLSNTNNVSWSLWNWNVLHHCSTCWSQQWAMVLPIHSGVKVKESRGSTKQRPDLDSACLKTPLPTFCLTILMDLNFSYFFLFKIWAIFPCLKRGQLPVPAQGSGQSRPWLNAFLHWVHAVSL